MPSPGMTYRDMIDEVINFRFNTAQDIYVKRWLAARELQVWGAAEWPFKKMYGVHLTLNAGDEYLDLPGGVRRVEEVYDDTGVRLTWFPPDEFALRNRGETIAGTPSEYTLSGNQIVLAPPAAGDTEYTIDYERSMFHYDVNGTGVTGPMSLDTDYPAWDPSYYWILVPGAMATGLKMENDPTWPPLEEEFTNGIMAMQEDLLPPSHASTLQYGRDELS